MLLHNGFLVYLLMVFAYDLWHKYSQNNEQKFDRPKNKEEA